MSEESSSRKLKQAEVFHQFLLAEGYLPTIDEDGDLLFKFEGTTFLWIVDGNDSDFFRLVIPNFWSIGSEEERSRVKTACLEVMKTIKVVKILPMENDTWAAIEMFVSPIQSVQDVFKRCLRCLQHSIQAFHKEMQDLQLKDDEADEF